MLLFILIAYLALMSSKKAEQNKVWVGLSKETAHQLGTPISSLLAWLDLLELNGVDKDLLNDMGKDVKRLSVIAERFSKIGSIKSKCPKCRLRNAAVGNQTESSVKWRKRHTPFLKHVAKRPIRIRRMAVAQP